jgi:hypothetical protein
VTKAFYSSRLITGSVMRTRGNLEGFGFSTEESLPGSDILEKQIFWSSAGLTKIRILSDEVLTFSQMQNTVKEKIK